MPQGCLHGRVVLIVEDEYMIAIDMADHLEKAGAEVVGPVAFVKDALDLIDDVRHLDAAVLDVNLGGGETAYPIANRLAKMAVPYVLATGDLQVLRGCTGPTLEKPVGEAALIGALCELLAPRTGGCAQ